MANANDKLVGTWKLVSASSTTTSGERIDTPYGVNPAGLLTYFGDGRVTSLISYGDRKLLSIGSGTRVLEEQAEAFNTFFAYAGRFTFSGEKITHHVEISSIQNYVGKDLIRTIEFEGDRIKLITPPTLVNGIVQTVELVWQRLSTGS